MSGLTILKQEIKIPILINHTAMGNREAEHGREGEWASHKTYVIWMLLNILAWHGS